MKGQRVGEGINDDRKKKYNGGENRQVLNNPGPCSQTAINVEPEGQPTLFCSKTKPGLMRVSLMHK